MVDTTYSHIDTTTNLPDWYTQYLQQVMGQAQTAASDTYHPYEGQTVAGLTPDQLRSFALINGGVNTVGQYINQAGNFYNAAGAGQSGQAGATSLAGASSLYNSGAGVNSAGAYSPYAKDASALARGAFDVASPYVKQSTEALGLQQASPYVNQSTIALGLNQASPYVKDSTTALGLQQASPYVTQSTSALGLQAASPYLQNASGSFPGAAAAYMNPYISGVTDRIAQLGARNLSENILPAISDDFVRAGQYGSTRQRDLVGRAARDTQDSILGQQATALEQGYGQAGQLYESDAARQAQLASTAGQLGTQQQQILQQAGLGLGGLGTSQQQILQQAGLGLGGLGTQQQQILQQAGLGLGNLGTQQQQILQSAGFGLGNLNLNQAQALSGIGAQYAGLMGQDASRQIAAGQGLAGIGQTQIGASQADLARMLGSAQGIQGLGQDYTNNTLRFGAALDANGQEQQGQSQRNLDAGYQEYLRQQQYPWQVIGNLSNVIQGLPVNTSSSSNSSSSAPSPSATQQIAGVGLGVAGLANSGIFRAKGGAVKKPKSAVSYGIAPRRGLSFDYKKAA